MPEFEKCLMLPLSRCAALRVSGETHARGLEWRLDGFGSFGGDVDGSGLFEHLEVGGDLVEGELFGPVAFVDDDDFE